MADFVSSSSDKEVILISGDGEEFRVSTKVGMMSILVSGMITDDEIDEEKRVPLPNVRKDILAKVLEYCNHYVTEPMTEFVKVRSTITTNYLYIINSMRHLMQTYFPYPHA